MVTKTRWELCKLVADRFDWLMVDFWGCLQNKFLYFKNIMEMLYKRLKEACSWLRETNFHVNHNFFKILL